MAIQWLRLWHDMPNDPKWRTIARASKQPIPCVIAVYLHLLVSASANANERGRTKSVCHEDVASALDMDCEQVGAIIDAMQGRVLDGDMIAGWDKRQVEREDGAAARAKAWREAKKEQDRTQPNATERKETPDKDKDKDKEEQTSMSPQSADPEDVRLCPVGSLVDLYHSSMPENPRVKVLNEKRKAAIRARWKDASKFDFAPFGYKTRSEGLEKWRTFFEVCAESDFMTGKVAPAQGRKLFIADIDFIFSPDGFAKILENKYHQRQA